MEFITLQIGLVIIASAVTGVILHYFKQPLILAYILAGILIGPYGFSFVEEHHVIEGLASVGVMLMLFLIGLEMNITRLKDIGKIALVAGIGQVLFTGLIGFGVVLLFGFSLIQSAYLAVALTFSSTVIAVKIMSDKNDTKSLYGQICIGILIVQDILAIMALLFLAGFQEGSFHFDPVHFGGILIKGALLAFVVIFGLKRLVKFIYNKIATSHELLVLFSLSWCFLISIIAYKIGFSMEIGAFIAGVSLANLPYALEINVKAKVLRDFFITIFFATLGMTMVFSSIGSLLLPLVMLSLFVLIGNPLIVLTLMGLMGYDKRTSFFTGLSIANISEFSLIVIALGNSLGHIDQEVVSMTAIIAITTMVTSSYMMVYNNQLFTVLKKYLVFFEFRRSGETIKVKKSALHNHIVLIGCGQVGEQVLEQMLGFKEEYVVVDYDNQVINDLLKKNINCVFGDAENKELLDNINLDEAELIISTLPNPKDNYFIMKYIKKLPQDKRPIMIAVADSGREGMDLFNSGVDYVILKPYLGADHIHNINKEIYQLDDAHKKVSIHKSNKEKGYNNDNELARILHNLNKLRLIEIREKIKQKEDLAKK